MNLDTEKLTCLLYECAGIEQGQALVAAVEEAIHRNEVATISYHQAGEILEPYMKSEGITVGEALRVMPSKAASEVRRLFKLADDMERLAWATGFFYMDPSHAWAYNVEAQP